jgi:pilus assembly protein Flp/PilA
MLYTEGPDPRQWKLMQEPRSSVIKASLYSSAAPFLLTQNGEPSMSKLVATASKLVREEEGASLAEYGLLLALIAVVCIAAVTTLGTSVKGIFNAISSTI